MVKDVPPLPLGDEQDQPYDDPDGKWRKVQSMGFGDIGLEPFQKYVRGSVPRPLGDF